jgi:hypothetical protein
MKKNAPSQVKKFTPEELLAKFRIAVGWFNAAELEELRTWLERVTSLTLSTPEQIAAAWLKVSLGEIREELDNGIRALEAGADPATVRQNYLTRFSPPPPDRRN